MNVSIYAIALRGSSNGEYKIIFISLLIIIYERALRAVKSNLDKCSVSVTLIAIPKSHLRSS